MHFVQASIWPICSPEHGLLDCHLLPTVAHTVVKALSILHYQDMNI